MTDPKKKKKVETAPSGVNAVYATNIQTPAQKISERDGRMQGRRNEEDAAAAKKAGGQAAYTKKIAKSKAGLIKYKGKYVSRTGAMGKKAIAELKK